MEQETYLAAIHTNAALLSEGARLGLRGGWWLMSWAISGLFTVYGRIT